MSSNQMQALRELAGNAEAEPGVCPAPMSVCRVQRIGETNRRDGVEQSKKIEVDWETTERMAGLLQQHCVELAQGDQAVCKDTRGGSTARETEGGNIDFLDQSRIDGFWLAAIRASHVARNGPVQSL